MPEGPGGGGLDFHPQNVIMRCPKPLSPYACRGGIRGGHGSRWDFHLQGPATSAAPCHPTVSVETAGGLGPPSLPAVMWSFPSTVSEGWLGNLDFYFHLTVTKGKSRYSQKGNEAITSPADLCCYSIGCKDGRRKKDGHREFCKQKGPSKRKTLGTSGRKNEHSR